jgi:exosortase/archaeosortase family protein
MLHDFIPWEILVLATSRVMSKPPAQPVKGKKPSVPPPAVGTSVRRFLITFALVFGGLMALTYQVLYWAPIFDPFATFNARLCTLILGPFFESVSAEGLFLSARWSLLDPQEFKIAIRPGCDSFQASAVLLAGISAFPATWKERLIGAVVGLVFLFLLNLARLCLMLLVGLRHPSLFDTFHLEIMPVVFVASALAAWILWAMKVGPPAKVDTTAATGA